MERLVRHRWVALALLLLLTAALLPGAQRAAVPDNSLEVWFLETDPQLVAYREFQASFGNDETILLLVEEREGIFSPAALGRLRQVIAELEALAGVRAVHSILSMRDAWQSEDGLRFERVLPDPLPADPAEFAAARDRALSNRLFHDRLIDRDGRLAMLWVELRPDPDFDAKRDAIVRSVVDTADRVLSEAPHALGGLGVIYTGLNEVTQRDFGLFLGVGYLLIFAMLGWIFRSVRLVGSAVAVVVVATLVALGAYGWAGHRLNMVTVVLPTLIVVLGIADAVHFPAAWVEARRDDPKGRRGAPAAAVAALRRAGPACLMTTLTTMAGFLALSSSPMAVIRQMGLYAALGIGAALGASLVVMAVALGSAPPDRPPPQLPTVRSFLAWVRGLLLSRRRALALGTLGLVGLAAVGASTVVADTYTIGYLPDDHRVVTDHARIEDRWGPYSLLDFRVLPTEGRADSPEVLAAIERFMAAAAELPEVRNGYALPTIYRRMAEVLGSDAPGGEPMSRELVAQLALLLEMQPLEWDPSSAEYGDNFLAPVLSEDGATGRITLVGSMMSAGDLARLLGRLEAIGRDAMGGAARLEPAGYPPLYVRIVDYAVSSQVTSFFLAVGIIFALMLAWLRSPRLALLSLPPNLLPVLVMLGVMGALGIRLDIATATVAAIVIGVAIDDTVHFLVHWREAERDGLGWEAALERVYDRAGVPAVVTTLLLVTGFPVLMLASVKTVFAFGLLTTVAAATALFADLVLLPLLLRAWPARPAGA